MDNNHRNTIIDIVKSLGIFCMVAGHCGFPFTHFIYLFHMAIFFMASGYCYKENDSNKIDNLISFIKRKFVKLWFPYVIWTAIYSLLHNFFIKINVYTDNPVLLEHVSGKYINLTEYWSLADIVKNIIKSLLFHGGTQMGGAFWFLATLMEISVIYCIIDFVIKNYFKLDLKKTIIIQWVISIVFLFLGFACFKTNHSFSGLSRVLSYYILFHGGYIIKYYGWHEKNKSVTTQLVLLVCNFVILVICNNFGSIELGQNSYKNPFYLLVVSFVGWQFLYEVAFFIEKTHHIKTIITIGQNTLAIVILHFLSFKIVSYIGVLFNQQPLCLVAAFPVLYRGGAWWIAYCFVGITIPVFLSLIWKKISIIYKYQQS